MRFSKAFSLVVLAALLGFAFVIGGCSSDDDDAGDDSSADRYGASLQGALEDTLYQYNGPGAVLAVNFADGSQFIGSAGVSDLSQPDTAMDAANHFRIGSVTKTFTGTAILLLVQDETLSLEDSIEDWLPGLIPGGDAITLTMLLKHTSGLYDFTWSEDEYLTPYSDDLTGLWTPEELVAISVENGPFAAPGEQAVYSNTNFVLLGMVIEAASGQSAETFIAENVFEPMGMDDTYFPTTCDMPAPYTHGYLDEIEYGDFTVDEDVTAQHPSAIWTAGAIVSTPADLLVWLGEINDSVLLDANLQARRVDFSQQMDGAPTGFFGMGIAKMDGGVGHTGAVPGYQTVILRYRGTDFVVYSNGYLLGKNAANITSKIYAAAVEAVYPGSNVEI